MLNYSLEDALQAECQRVARELLSFAYLFRPDEATAAAQALDAVLFGLEAGAFEQRPTGELRCVRPAELFRFLWERLNAGATEGKPSETAKIFQLGIKERAAAYLVVRQGFSPQDAAGILAVTWEELDACLEEAYAVLLGRSPESLAWEGF